VQRSARARPLTTVIERACERRNGTSALAGLAEGALAAGHLDGHEMYRALYFMVDGFSRHLTDLEKAIHRK
jgi:hypothetical protein